MNYRPNRTTFARWIRFFLLGAGLILGGCPDPCITEVQRELSSPDGRVNAIVFTRDCGAITTPAVHVSVVAKGEAVSTSGNVLSGRSGHNPKVSLDPQAACGGDERNAKALSALAALLQLQLRSEEFIQRAMRDTDRGDLLATRWLTNIGRIFQEGGFEVAWERSGSISLSG